MGWQHKGRNGLYYYRSVREGDRVRTDYIGRGEDAQKLAQEVEQRRQERLADQKAYQRELDQVSAAELHLRDLRSLADLFLNAVLLTTNHYKHHGQWRRRRNGNSQRDGAN